jgi:putative molybdopterin biosynthesis protein
MGGRGRRTGLRRARRFIRAGRPSPDAGGGAPEGKRAHHLRQDVSLDILVSYLNAKFEGIPYTVPIRAATTASTPVSGKGERGYAHLWDGDADTYNVTYVKKMMPGIPAAVIRIGRRRAGLYVREGNRWTLPTGRI